MCIAKPEKRRVLCLDLCEVARPVDNIILIFVVEDHLGVDEVLDHLLTTAVLEELRPCRVNNELLLVVVREWVVVHHEGRSHVDVGAGE